VSVLLEQILYILYMVLTLILGVLLGILLTDEDRVIKCLGRVTAVSFVIFVLVSVIAYFTVMTEPGSLNIIFQGPLAWIRKIASDILGLGYSLLWFIVCFILTEALGVSASVATSAVKLLVSEIRKIYSDYMNEW